MTSCCTRLAHAGPPSGGCPACGSDGHQVETITVKAMLRPLALARLEPAAYRFCSDPGCPAVYFCDSGSRPYLKEDLKVRVGIKEAEDPVPICYCFAHTRKSIWEEIQRTGQSSVAQSITAHIQAGRCGCEVNNPSGACCLGEVRRTVKELIP